jgi:hypothetical protein
MAELPALSVGMGDALALDAQNHNSFEGEIPAPHSVANVRLLPPPPRVWTPDAKLALLRWLADVIEAGGSA